MLNAGSIGGKRTANCIPRMNFVVSNREPRRRPGAHPGLPGDDVVARVPDHGPVVTEHTERVGRAAAVRVPNLRSRTSSSYSAETWRRRPHSCLAGG